MREKIALIIMILAVSLVVKVATVMIDKHADRVAFEKYGPR